MLIKGLVGAVGVMAVVLSAGSARADNYVYGGSSGLASSSTPPSGDFLALTYAGGIQYAPLGINSFFTGVTEIVRITHGNTGWFSSTTEEGPAGDSYVTGNVGGSHLRSFLSFDTAGLPIGATAVSLDLDTNTVSTLGTETVDFTGGVNNLDGSGPADSTTDANHVLTTEQSSSPSPSDIAAIYTALGTGPLYGTYGYTAASSNTQVSIPLDANLISDINFSLETGNILFTIGADDITPVPEPGSVALIAIATPIALRRRRNCPL